MPRSLSLVLSFLLLTISFPVFAGGNVRVSSVIDGDTIRIKLGSKTETVRFIGVDAPELKGKAQEKCFGKEANEKVKMLLRGKSVVLETNPVEDRDNFGRLLRYIVLGNKDIGAQLITEGYAYSYKKFSHPRLTLYNQLEEQAKTGRKGLWNACQSGAVSSVSSKKKSGDEQTSAPAGCVIKGNISAKGEKIYHASFCRSYKQTTITPSTGERWFCTEQEAKDAGWRRAGNCS